MTLSWRSEQTIDGSILLRRAPSGAFPDDLLRTSQLVSGNLCAANVVNGGCSPSTSALVSAIVASARN